MNVKQIRQWVLITIVCYAASCTAARKPATVLLPGNDNKIEVVFVQVNDVYEITPIAGGKEGGMARVATVKKQLLQENKNTFLVMAGDFLSPSIYNSLKYNGSRVRGAQMIDAMNAAGTDIAVFGNHEFDITEAELQQRINESGFNWVASNVLQKTAGDTLPFKRTIQEQGRPIYEVMKIKVADNDGTNALLGIIGITLTDNKADYVYYKDPLATAREMYSKLKDSVDAVIAITHQTVADDSILAAEVPGIDVILGGHEHGMIIKKVNGTYITKAHANARSAYIVKVAINKKTGAVSVQPQLKYLNETVALDSNTHKVVQKWVDIAANNYASIGFDAGKVVLADGPDLDARETKTRTGSTNFTELVTAAMAYAAPQADVVIVNAGSIRLDDVLQPPITQYDIIRSLPFGGGITEVEMKGDLLKEILKAGRNNRGSGGYLHSRPTTYISTLNNFAVAGQPIASEKVYRVALTDFLLTGLETNMSFLTKQHPGIIKVYNKNPASTSALNDIRLAIIHYITSL